MCVEPSHYLDRDHRNAFVHGCVLYRGCDHAYVFSYEPHLRQDNPSVYTHFLVEVEYGMGNFEILSANIGILTASSFVMINSHLKGHNASILIVILLGFLFFLNQIDETFSHVSIDMANEASSVLACLYIHLSHLILCEILFVVSLLYNSLLRNGTDMVMELASVYWHLVEVVWIVILSAFCSI